MKNTAPILDISDKKAMDVSGKYNKLKPEKFRTLSKKEQIALAKNVFHKDLTFKDKAVANLIYYTLVYGGRLVTWLGIPYANYIEKLVDWGAKRYGFDVRKF